MLVVTFFFCCVPYIVLGSSFYLCLVRGHLLVIFQHVTKLGACPGVIFLSGKVFRYLGVISFSVHLILSLLY